MFRELGYFTKVTSSAMNYCNFYNSQKLVYANVKNIKTFQSSGVRTGTFENCSKLDHAVIGNATTMNARIFVNCSALRWVVIYATTVPAIMTTTFPSGCKIYVPDEAVDSYKEASVWSSIASRIFPMSQFLTDFPGETKDL